MTDAHDLARRADPPTRRAFLSGLARAGLGVAAWPWLARAADDVPNLLPASARQVIVVFMKGGLSHLDSWDPKPGAETQGPTGVIPTAADGLQLSEHFPLLARRMADVAVVSSMQTTQGAHAQGVYAMHTAYELVGTIRHPTLGAWLTHLGGPLNPTLPGHVEIGGGRGLTSPGFLPSATAALPLGDPEAGLAHAARPEGVRAERYAARLERLAAMNRSFAERHPVRAVQDHSEAFDQALALMDSRDLAAFDLTRESEATRDGYGRTPFGQGCLLARRLVEHGVRCVEVVSDGWDLHSDLFDSMGEQAPEVDRGLAALLADLSARGLLQETLVVVATEFGRTPRIDPKRVGRNHHPQAFSVLLAGGGVVGGQRIGATDATGTQVISDPVRPQDLQATLALALGLPLDVPAWSPEGRPITVADDGRPLRELFG